MSFNCQISDTNKNRISTIFKNMSYGEFLDSDAIAIEWVKQHSNLFTSFINGIYTDTDIDPRNFHAINNANTGHFLANVSIGNIDMINKIGEKNNEYRKKSYATDGYQRAQCLHKIAKNIEKHLQLFSVLESISTGKHLHKTKSQDVPLLIQSLYYYGGLASEWKTEMKDREIPGIACICVEEYNNPLMSVCWQLGAALASGNTIIMLPDASSCLSIFLLAEVCKNTGLPPYILNVIPLQKNDFEFLKYNEISKVLFSGSFERSQELRKISAINAVDVVINSCEQPTVLILEGADLHSACKGVLETFCFHDTRSKSGGCSVLLQDAVKEDFMSLLTANFSQLKVGHCLSKTDLSACVTKQQTQELLILIGDAKSKGAQILTVNPCNCLTANCTSYPPTLVYNLQTSSELLMNKIGGPILSVVPFKTVKEGISIFNHSRNGSDVSVWTEQLTVALEVAHHLKTGTVWVNCQNEFDAAAPYSRVYKRGNFIAGGKSALFQFTVQKHLHEFHCTFATDYENFASFGETPDTSVELKSVNENISFGLHHIYKLYYGGQYKNSDSNTSRAIYGWRKQILGYVANGSRKDIRNAVECAVRAQPGWQAKNGHYRAQVLYRIAENLELRKFEFMADLKEISNCIDSDDEVNRPIKYTVRDIDEVNRAIKCLFYWASYCDKYRGSILETSMYGKVLETNEPLGVIGIICQSDQHPFLSFVPFVASAIACGNTVVIVPDEDCPAFALKMCEIFEMADVPAGVINVITGKYDHLARHLTLHMDVDAIWFYNQGDIYEDAAAFCRNATITNQKRLWLCDSEMVYLLDSDVRPEYVFQGTYNKTIWLPMGDIFAN